MYEEDLHFVAASVVSEVAAEEAGQETSSPDLP